MADRGNAANGKARGRAYVIGRGLAHLVDTEDGGDLGSVDPVTARRNDQDGLAVGHEDQRRRDLGGHDAERVGRLLGGARRVIEAAYLTRDTCGGERLTHADDGFLLLLSHGGGIYR